MAATLEKSKLLKITTQEIEKYLTEHPDLTGNDDSQRAYEMAITDMIVQIENLLQNDDRKNSDEMDVQMVCDTITPLFSSYAPEQEKLAYAAYFSLCTFYRRRSLHDSLEALLKSAPDSFKEKLSYKFVSLMCKKMQNPNDLSLLKQADALCAPDSMGHNYGVEHCFAEYVADACENNETRVPYLIKEYMQKAIDRIESAIEKSSQRNGGESYPKFYVTRARLLNIKAVYGDPKEQETYFSLGQADIRKAYFLETSKSRQTEYQMTGIRLQSFYYQRTLDRNIKRQEETIEKQIQENNVKNLEFLSFFSAIIGLLIAGTQIMMGMKFAEGATLLVALTGCLITAFGAIGFVLHNKPKRWIVNTIIVILGIALTVFAMLYGGKYAM